MSQAKSVSNRQTQNLPSLITLGLCLMLAALAEHVKSLLVIGASISLTIGAPFWLGPVVEFAQNRGDIWEGVSSIR